ncbi:MAG: DNA repair protein RecO [Gammaproteobacteria bacterium]|nr:DNA repair protein RecO [Gammaproteobacteria bacterium]
MSDPGLRPAYVLHRRPYRESSLLVELLTRDEGRVGVVARGARQKRGRDALEPFVELLARWRVRGDLGQLHHAEAVASSPRPQGRALYSGFYLNELLMRMLRRHDPHPELFACYAETLSALAGPAHDLALEVELRLFEARLLEACGYGLELRVDAVSGAPLDPDGLYRYEPELGPVASDGAARGGLLVHGRALHALAAGRLESRDDLRELKSLLRGLLAPHLGPRPLASRALFRAGRGVTTAASDGAA